MAIPKLYGVSAEATAQADAALSFELDVPEADKYPINETVNDKGERYVRWAEVALIEGAWLEASKGGYTTFVIKCKVRTGMPNQGKTIHARHYMDYDAMASGDEKKAGMNNRTIVALTGLTKATGFATGDGSLPADLLSMLFPMDKQAAGNSPLRSKVVTLNLCNAPNKGEQAKTPRKTNVDSYNTAGN